jgi:hypothetical protein
LRAQQPTMTWTGFLGTATPALSVGGYKGASGHISPGQSSPSRSRNSSIGGTDTRPHKFQPACARIKRGIAVARSSSLRPSTTRQFDRAEGGNRSMRHDGRSHPPETHPREDRRPRRK